MAGKTELLLHEELLLLALRDEKGTVHSRAGMLGIALGGGILSELAMAERVRVTEDKRPFVELVDRKRLGDDVLDDCLTRVRDARRRARAATWVSRFAQLSGLRNRVAAGLCRKRVLREDEDRVLWLFRRKLYPERDGRYEQRILTRMRKAIFSESQRVEPRTAMLVSLADAAGLLAIPFTRRELRERKERLKELREGQALSGATHAAVQAAVQATQAAIIAATTAASTAAITAATS
jgi:Golgi phosphoprotein 3